MKNGCWPVAKSDAEKGSVIVSKLIEPTVAWLISWAILSLNANLSWVAPIWAKNVSCDNGPFDPLGLSWKTMLKVG